MRKRHGIDAAGDGEQKLLQSLRGKVCGGRGLANAAFWVRNGNDVIHLIFRLHTK